MLQQTRVEAVKGYYARFLETLPGIRDVAEAEEDTCLKLWEGLGYYSRVRNLKKAAEEIVASHDGVIPGTYEELLRLPGVGPYTAAAVSSIAFGQPVPAVDGNLLRIFARLAAYGENILAPQAKKQAEAYFRERIPEGRPGSFNQALMDLGAMVCLPNSRPLCGECPLASYCRAHEAGTEMDYPFRPAKKKRAVEDMTVLLIHSGSGVLLRKRGAEGLLAGLYEFPNLPGHVGEKEAARYVESLGLEALRIEKLPAAKHIFSHKEWHMEGYEIFTGGWTEVVRREPAKGAEALAESSGERQSITGESAPAGPGDNQNSSLKKIPQEAGQDLDMIFLADLKDIEEKWSVPSAFRAFRDHLTGKK